jgi:hypothetical protein
MADQSLSAVTTTGLGETLGILLTKVDVWREQRASIVKELRQLAELTNSLLKELDGRGPIVGDGATVARGKGGRPKGFKASSATRAKLRAAWKRRRDSIQGPSRRTMSAEARAKISAAQRRRWARTKRRLAVISK